MLDKAIAWLIGGSLFKDVKNIVAGLFEEDKPGDEKRKDAFDQIKKVAGSTASFLINLAIEAAVVILKAKYEKK